MRNKILSKLTPLYFLLPYLSVFIFFKAYPIIRGFYISLYEWGIYGPQKFVKLQNYIELFKDERFWSSFYNTLFFSVMYVPGVVLISLILAVLLKDRLPGINIFRICFFIPIVINVAAASIALDWILAPQIGLLNRILELFGLPTQNWLGQEGWAMFVVAIVTIWMSAGFFTIIFLAGLENIPKELYDAAKVDGSDPLRNFIYITLPLIKPVTLLVSILAIVRSLQAFGQIYVLTGGGPHGSTEVLTYLLFEEGFTRFNFGRAASIGVFLTFVIAFLSYIQFKVFSER